MVRTILTILIPFLIPFLFYGLYAWFVARKKMREERGEVLQPWENWPWTWLIIVGGSFGLAALFFLFFDPDPPDEGVWVAPTVVDGEIVPGHFKPRTPTPDTD